MIERVLKIKNYRSIGNDDYVHFDLNAIGDPSYKFGGLITLIGMNNTGKSNFLDALSYLGGSRLETSDYPFYNYNADVVPTVSLWIKHHDKESKQLIEYQYKVKSDNVFIEKWVNSKRIEPEGKNNQITASKRAQFDINNVVYFLDGITAHGMFDEYNSRIDSGRRRRSYQEVVKTPEDTVLFDNNVNRFIEAIENAKASTASIEEKSELLRLFNSATFVETVINHGLGNQASIDEVIAFLKGPQLEIDKHPYAKEVRKKFHVNLVPNIIKYDDSMRVSGRDMMSDVSGDKLSNDGFFKKLFTLLNDRKYAELETAYRKFNASPNGRHFLTNFESLINRELDALAESFNTIYGYTENKQYQFALNLESNRVYFSLKENGLELPYDNQSTGFKWFFNFFFNVFADGDLKNGDIVILDEPATNLHVSGQVELRKQIKKFGIENGITFVISTHSPFLIHTDYLDEVRVVSKKDQYSIMDNEFSVSNDHLVDALLPIQTSLTVGRHIITDPENTVIFVEGITDYNYLVAFKNYLGFDQFTFLPVQGIKNIEKVFKVLLKTEKNPILLVDNDHAGNIALQKSEKYHGVEVRKISEVNEAFRCIEDLFTADEKASLPLDKSYHCSSNFKNYLNLNIDKISDSTKKNFEVLLKSLSI